MPLTETLNKELMWLDAFGLLSSLEMLKNDGVWSSQKMAAACERQREVKEFCRKPAIEGSSQRRTQSQTYAPLHWQHFWKTFKVFGAMLFLSLTAFFCEVIRVRRLKKRTLESWRKYAKQS